MALFSKEDLESLVLGYVEGAGARGASEEDIQEWIAWCEEIEATHLLLNLCISGEVLPYWDETVGEYIFSKKGSIN